MLTSVRVVTRPLAAIALLAIACGRTELDRGDVGTATATNSGHAGNNASEGSGGHAAGGSVAGSGGQAGTGGHAAGGAAAGGGQAGSGGHAAGGAAAGAGGQAGTGGSIARGGSGGAASNPDAAAMPGSCREIQEAGLSTGDGIYWIRTGTGAPIPVQCLMSADGGGWTLVGNFPWPRNTAGVSGWTSGAAVGSSFTDLTRPFKLSDADIHALRTYGFRAQGTATYCMLADGVSYGPCAIDTLLFWRATCNYASSSNSPACSTAYRDVAFTIQARGTSPCNWHYGLTAANCDSTVSAMGTSHLGDHVFVGEYQSFTHAFDGRLNENPSVRFWVR
jgi:hypothetical protein